jgi:Tol biopolymer transport system component
MSLIKIKFVITVSIVIVLIISGTIIYAKTPLQLMFIACDGELRILDRERTPAGTVAKIWLGDVPRGFLYGGDFFASIDNKLISSNLLSRKSIKLVNLQEAIDNNYKMWQIGYVDEYSIYFSVREQDKSASIIQKNNYLIYQFDRKNKETKKVIKNCGSPYFSVHDDKVYFVDSTGEISVFVEGTTTSTGLKGRFPSVSPDGTMIAYASFGIINEHINIYELKAKTSISIIRFFGPDVVNPIIRWSKDSDHVAVKKKSDLKSGPIYILNISNKNIVRKIEDGHACNWFFVDK